MFSLLPRLRIAAFLTLLVSSVATHAHAQPAPKTVRIAGAEMFALGFEVLSAFPYTIVDIGTGATPEQIEAARARDQVPDWIRAYDGKRVVLSGYMMPLSFEDGVSDKFVLMRDINTCCYGATPNMNDYVIVTMKGRGVVPTPDIVVRVTGTFRVEEKFEDNYLVSLFVLDGEEFLGAER